MPRSWLCDSPTSSQVLPSSALTRQTASMSTSTRWSSWSFSAVPRTTWEPPSLRRRRAPSVARTTRQALPFRACNRHSDSGAGGAAEPYDSGRHLDAGDTSQSRHLTTIPSALCSQSRGADHGPYARSLAEQHPGPKASELSNSFTISGIGSQHWM